MLKNSKSRARAAVALACAFLSAPLAHSQSPDFTVTATRTPQALSKAGSSVTVISGDELRRGAPSSLAEILRGVAGVSLTQSGGIGGIETIRLRGSESRHTLVLLDGVRLNDPSSTGREFDFSSLIPVNIERIEIVRGAQSALYGSDAIGGVINIITKRGGKPRGTLAVEGGSYGTRAVQGGISGSRENVDYAFGITALQTEGFSRYGYRIRRLQPAQPLEDDGAQRLGAQARVGVQITPDARVEANLSHGFNKFDYDAGFGDRPDSASRGLNRTTTGHIRGQWDTWNKQQTHTLTLFGNQAVRNSLTDSTFFGFDSLERYRYLGQRSGAEYQVDTKFGAFGTLTAGVKYEREAARSSSSDWLFDPIPRLDFTAAERSQSVYLMHQFTVAERLHLTLGGRVDKVLGGDTFVTGRGTLAYDIPFTESTFRTSIGTGGKAPSLYQRFSEYGRTDLRSEHSLSVDAGFTHRLFEDRLRLTTTGFFNRYRDLIGFAFSGCRSDQPFGCYFNTARAQTQGFELEAKARFIPNTLEATLAYTALEAKDLDTQKRLPRRPEHEARFGVMWAVTPQWRIEPSVTFVGTRFDGEGETKKLKPYARLDIRTDYRINSTFTVFARGDNLLDTRYEEVKDYGTPGRSVYAGLRVEW
jgi:vitamin B12 transporter